jgi:hypothetical protein
LVLLLFVLGLGWLGYGYLFGDEGAGTLSVETVDGAVRRVDVLGGEQPAKPGDTLQLRDRLIADAGGRAVLSLGPDARVTVEESSSVRVLAVDEANVRLELEGGKVQATIRPGARSLGIEADGRALTTGDADFTAARSSDGTLGVTTTRGSVAVTGVPGAERLSAGQRLVAAPGGEAFLAPASAELLLNVAWPEATRTRAERVEVRGKTEPGARVRVGREGAWTEVVADATGAFSAQISLADGVNDVSVEARSVLGEVLAATHVIERDTRPPTLDVRVGGFGQP